MNVTIVDYNSGNISSVINSFKEVAKDKVSIEVTSDLNKIKSSDKVVLPGQGSFKSCVDALNNINGLVDTLNPTLSSSSPSDDSTNVDVSSDIKLTFSESVERGTGNIYIKKSSNNSTVETIDVASAQVEGIGTNEITINPNLIQNPGW